MLRSPSSKQDAVYGSAPNLHENKEDEGSDSINSIPRSNKRRRCDCGNSAESKIDTFIITLSSWKQDTEKILSNIQVSMNEIKQQNSDLLASNAEIEKSIDFLSLKYDDLHNQLNSFQDKTKENVVRITRIEEYTEELDRNSRSSSLEIRNIPIQQSHSQPDLIRLITPIFKAILVDVLHSDIYDIRCLPTKSDNKIILITFNSVILKNNILRAYKEYNKKNSSNKLNTAIIRSEKPRQMIYIAENLTPRARKLFFLAREFAKEENFKHCWTAQGKVLLRKEDNARYFVIATESQLHELRSKN